jgi:hypothetical protein
MDLGSGATERCRGQRSLKISFRENFDVVRFSALQQYLPIAEVAVVQLTMAGYGHVPTLDEAKAAFTLVLILMKYVATHVDSGLSRLSTPANLLVLLQRYIPT